MEWQETFSVGITEFDNHHRHLFELINEARTACLQGNPTEVFNGIVKDLAEYVSYHFTAEEQFMKDHSYPGFEAHRKEHTQFVKKTADAYILMMSREVANAIDLTDLTDFLMNWLFHHILEVDMQYRKLISE